MGQSDAHDNGFLSGQFFEKKLYFPCRCYGNTKALVSPSKTVEFFRYSSRLDVGEEMGDRHKARFRLPISFDHKCATATRDFIEDFAGSTAEVHHGKGMKVNVHGISMIESGTGPTTFYAVNFILGEPFGCPGNNETEVVTSRVPKARVQIANSVMWISVRRRF